MKVSLNEITVKSILTPSKLPDADYVVNPYLGCSFGCKYCYASFMAKFSAIPESSWGSFVSAKINAAEVVKKELAGNKKEKYNGKKILLSSVTDPYQPCENRYRLTRSILQEFISSGITSNIDILTRSPLIIRDKDVLSQLPNCKAGMTVHYLEEDMRIKQIEPKGYHMTKRLKSLAELAQAGIQTYAFIGPLFPYMLCEKERMDHLLYTLKESGVKEVFFEDINRSTTMVRMHQKDIAAFEEEGQANAPAHNRMTDEQVIQMAQNHGLSVRLSNVLRH